MTFIYDDVTIRTDKVGHYAFTHGALQERDVDDASGFVFPP